MNLLRDGVTHYERLNLSRDANSAEIEKSFRRWSLLLHPDKEGGSHDQWDQMQSMFEVLRNENSKMVYDVTLEDGLDVNDETLRMFIQAVAELQETHYVGSSQIRQIIHHHKEAIRRRTEENERKLKEAEEAIRRRTEENERKLKEAEDERELKEAEDERKVPVDHVGIKFILRDLDGCRATPSKGTSKRGRIPLSEQYQDGWVEVEMYNGRKCHYKKVNLRTDLGEGVYSMMITMADKHHDTPTVRERKKQEREQLWRNAPRGPLPAVAQRHKRQCRQRVGTEPRLPTITTSTCHGCGKRTTGQYCTTDGCLCFVCLYCNTQNTGLHSCVRHGGSAIKHTADVQQHGIPRSEAVKLAIINHHTSQFPAASFLFSTTTAVLCEPSDAEVVVVDMHSCYSGSGETLLKLLDVQQHTPKVLIVLWCWVAPKEQHSTLNQLSYQMKDSVVLSYRVEKMFVDDVFEQVTTAAINHVRFSNSRNWNQLVGLCGTYTQCCFWHQGGGPFKLIPFPVQLSPNGVDCVSCGTNWSEWNR